MATETKIDTKIGTDLYEALVCERRCGNQVLGEEIYFVKEGKAFAQMLGDADPVCRARALEVVTILNDATPRGAFPSKLLRDDRGKRYDEECARNAEHIAKTIDLNMKMSQEKWELVDHLWNRVVKHVGMASQADKAQAQRNAIRWAAELYSIRSFVTGVIRGRLYKMAEGHIESQVRKWEDQWDQAFGDLVGEVLNMQD